MKKGRIRSRGRTPKTNQARIDWLRHGRRFDSLVDRAKRLGYTLATLDQYPPIHHHRQERRRLYRALRSREAQEGVYPRKRP